MNVAFTVIFALEITFTLAEAFPNWSWGGEDKRTYWSPHHSETCCAVGHCVKAWSCPKSAVVEESEKGSCVYRENGPWVCCLINDDELSHHHWESTITHTSETPHNFKRTTIKQLKLSTIPTKRDWHESRKPQFNGFKNINEEEELPHIRPLGGILKNDGEKYPFYRPKNKTISTKIPSVNVTNGRAGNHNKSTVNTNYKLTTNLLVNPRTSTTSPNYYRRTTNMWNKLHSSTPSPYYKRTTSQFHKPHTSESRIFSTKINVTSSPPTQSQISNNGSTKRSWFQSTTAAWGYTSVYNKKTTPTTTKFPHLKKSTTSTKASTQRKNQSWGSSSTTHSTRAQTIKPKTTKPSSNRFTTKSTRRNSITTPLPNVNIHLCGIGNERTSARRQRRDKNYGHNSNVDIVHSDHSGSRGRLPYERIVGGEEAEPFSWPWVAALYKVTSSGGNRFLSAGSLINEDFILTAAHVFTPDDIRTASYVVMLGTHDAQDAVAQYTVSSVLLHPNYEHRYYYNDIALLKLERKVNFNNYVMPICLPSPNAPLHADKDLLGKNVTVMGWGDDSFGGKSSQVLKEASFPIVSRVSCNASYVRVASNRFPKGITADMLCAGDPRGGKDACQGDSGGPLTVIENRRYTQVGIVSFGYKCGDKEFPGVYTKVAPYLSWIAENTRYVDTSRDYEYY